MAQRVKWARTVMLRLTVIAPASTSERETFSPCSLTFPSNRHLSWSLCSCSICLCFSMRTSFCFSSASGCLRVNCFCISPATLSLSLSVSPSEVFLPSYDLPPSVLAHDACQLTLFLPEEYRLSVCLLSLSALALSSSTASICIFSRST